MLVKMEHIGGCKPSHLLAVMMEFCHAKSEKSLPFHYYFAHHLLQVLSWKWWSKVTSMPWWPG
jgi:hypothetical protein